MKGEYPTMKRLTRNKTSLRNVLRFLLLVIVVTAASSTNLAAAKVQPPDPGAAPDHAYTRVRRTVSTSLVKVDFQRNGLYVAAKFNANNLKDETIRMALFLGWANGTWLEPNADAPSGFRSKGGYLTQQTTDVASYTFTEWSYVEFFIPWEYFPPITENADVFLQTFVGLDGQSFVANSWRQYFVLYAPS
jgi:hypothetical protein